MNIFDTNLHPKGARKPLLWLAVALLAMSACGGSGGGGVAPPPTGTSTVTLTWGAPTNNSDGSVLADLAGYKVYYGDSPTNLINEIDITDPLLEQFTVRNLAAGQYHFVIRSYNIAGTESLDSNIASISVN